MGKLQKNDCTRLMRVNPAVPAAGKPPIGCRWAENCARARQAKAGFDSGARIATTNKAGERVILDDDARAAESKRLQGVIQSECN
jgi:hypothetical protein